MVQILEGVSLVITSIMILILLRRKGRNRILFVLAGLFFSGGLFRLGMFFQSSLSILPFFVGVVPLVGILTDACLYFGVAGYGGMQLGFLKGARVGRAAFWIGFAIAAALTLFHTVVWIAGRASQPMILLAFLVAAFAYLAVIFFLSVAVLKKTRLPLANFSTINAALGLMLVAWILQKTVQTTLPAFLSVPLSFLPFLSIAVVIIALFLQSSAAMVPGVVYDAATKKPIPMAIVRLFRIPYHKLLETRVTGADGRYGILAAPGAYTMEAEAKGYRFPPSALLGYRGDALDLKTHQLLGKDIYLDPAA